MPLNVAGCMLTTYCRLSCRGDGSRAMYLSMIDIQAPSWQSSRLGPKLEISNFASLSRDRFALIQLTYVCGAQMIGSGSTGWSSSIQTATEF